MQANNLVQTIWLNRPQRRNAIDGQVVDELMHCLDAAAADDAVRVVVLRGRGDYFCAGGDLKWMGSGADLPEAERPAMRLATLFSVLYAFPKPVVAVVQGAALGGALGLVSAADFVVADSQALFSFTELRLGLIPAVISPYVIRKIGPAMARKLMLSARRLSATEALHLGLADQVAAAEGMEEVVAGICDELVVLAPGAMKACKAMLNRVTESILDEEMTAYTANQLHQVQHGGEAKEGIAAFFEKRKPSWIIS